MFKFRKSIEFNEYVCETRRQAAAIRNVAAGFSVKKDRPITCIHTEVMKNPIQGLRQFKLQNDWH